MTAAAISRAASDRALRASGAMRATSTAEATTLTRIARRHPTRCTQRPRPGEAADAVRKKAAVRRPRPKGPIPSSGPISKKAAPVRKTGSVETVTTATLSTSSRIWWGEAIGGRVVTPESSHPPPNDRQARGPGTMVG